MAPWVSLNSRLEISTCTISTWGTSSSLRGSSEEVWRARVPQPKKRSLKSLTCWTFEMRLSGRSWPERDRMPVRVMTRLVVMV